MRSLFPKTVAAAAALLLMACATDPAAPTARPEPLTDASVAASPNFLEAATAAPSIANPVVSFWAKRGVERSVFMYYSARPGRTDSSVFMRFRVKKRSLERYPNGTLFAQGDSVLITATLIDPVNLIVDFQPSGLVFASNDPADIKLSYLETDPDWNEDGAVNTTDSKLQRSFRVWQLHAGLPWTPLISMVSTGRHEVEADVRGFTSYAVAY